MNEYLFFDHTKHDDDEEPPTLGVREPRKPKPPTRTGGAEADLLWNPRSGRSSRECLRERLSERHPIAA